jgi:hypothetical protein
MYSDCSISDTYRIFQRKFKLPEHFMHAER